MLFEVVAGSSAYFDGNTCHRHANVLKNGPKLSILTKAGIFQLYLSHINGKIR